MKAVPDQISRFVRPPFSSLGTDGFGRSDTREALRRHFEIDRYLSNKKDPILCDHGYGRPHEVDHTNPGWTCACRAGQCRAPHSG